MAWFQANFTGNFWPFQPPKIWKLKEELYFDSRCQPRIKFGGSNNLPISNHSLKQTAQSDGWPCWKVMSLRSQIVYVGQMEVAAFNLTLTNYISTRSFQNYGSLVYLPKGREQWSSAWLQIQYIQENGEFSPWFRNVRDNLAWKSQRGGLQSRVLGGTKSKTLSSLGPKKMWGSD